MMTTSKDALEFRKDRWSCRIPKCSIVFVSMRAQVWKCTCGQLQLAAADEEAAAELISDDDVWELQSIFSLANHRVSG